MSGITHPPPQLRTFTPARVGLGITGISQPVRDVLDFQRCHALARDAVHARLDSAVVAHALASAGNLASHEILRLHSAATDRTTYLQRPDLGRVLDESSHKLLVSLDHCPSDVAFIIADGLSALAVERHAAPLIAELLPRLDGWKIAPLAIVEQSRVAIGDPIGQALGAEIAVVLIGERPGLSSPDSLGAYITWQPRPGRTDAERICISNIRSEGLSYGRAAEQIHSVLLEARRLQLTGVAMTAAIKALRGEREREANS